MGKGGAELDKRTLNVTRIVGLLTPIVLAMYGLLVQLGYAADDHYAGWGALLAICGAWIAYGIYQYFKVHYTFSALVTRLIIYHVFAIAYLVFIAGFSIAILCGWSLLYLVSYLYFYLPGFAVSAATLILITLLDISFRHYTIHESITIILSVMGTILVGTAAVAISYLRYSEREELKDSQHREALERDRVLTIVNNLADAVFSTDRDGVVRIYNASSLNLLDTNQDLNGKHINDILHLADKDNNLVALFDLIKSSTGVTVNDTLSMKTVDDTVRLEITYAPIRSSYTDEDKTGMGDGFIVIARDVTKLKSLEEERDEFISVVSHELRTPIAVAEGTISNVQLMIERGLADQTKIDKNLKEAHEQVIFLAKMINDLSTLSRAERGVASEVEEIDVEAMAHSLHNEYSPEATEHKIHFNLELDPKLGTIHTSRLYLHELLQNFVTNAIKYTHQGSVILKISKKGADLIFAVTDSGIGISKTDQAKVFGKFYRSEDYRTRETGGTGLGLYVAAKLSKKLGTTIELKSRLNHGSTFSFTLPIKQPKPNKITIR